MEEEVVDGVIVNIEMIDEGEREVNNDIEMIDEGEKEINNDIEMIDEGEREINNDEIIIEGNETDNGEEKERCTPFTEHFHRMDSLDKEASRVSGMPAASKVLSTAAVLQLAFRSIGVVYGNIGTSPLYVFASTFVDRVPNKSDIIGALSLCIYTLTLFPLIKYVFIVLWANDNGEGGTLALYSLICRHSNVNAPPSQQREVMEISAYKLELPNKHLIRAEKIRNGLERNSFAKTGLLWLALLGTCMVIGDGILTPCISVLSAVGGVKKIDAGLSKDKIAMISIAILVVLFFIQRFGTDKLGYTFAPVILVWYLFIGTVGISNLIRHDSTVLKAFNPLSIVSYFKNDLKNAWISLGGVVLCMTGTEAMFADLGHFSTRSIQVAFTGLVYPCLICSYVGQAAYLSRFPKDVPDAFYKSTPEVVYWPMFTVAEFASIIASQAMISATFAIVKQSMALGCFPRVKVVHTSSKHEGQVYIPEINFLLLLACVFVTASFKDTTNIGNAYGIAMVAVMLVTSSLLTIIMLMIWQLSLALVTLFILVFVSFELLYLSSVLYKFTRGGYLPVTFAALLFFVMHVWHYVQTKRHAFEVEKKVSIEYLNSLGSSLGITRIPGVGLLFTELTRGIPAIFPHFLTNVPAIHSILVFASVKYLPINKVPPEERFLLQRVGPKEYKMYRCIARYGYRDRRVGNMEFEDLLMEHLKNLICQENSDQEEKREEVQNEIRFLEMSREAGVVYLLGHSEVKASEESNLFKKVIVNYVYDFLRRNFRQGFVDLQIPNNNLLQVGMNYCI